MLENYISFFDIACDLYSHDDKRFDEYQEMLQNELKNMSYEDMSIAFQVLNEKLQVLGYNKETSFFVTNNKSIPEDIKKKYSEELKTFNKKHQFYSSVINNLKQNLNNRSRLK